VVGVVERFETYCTFTPTYCKCHSSYVTLGVRVGWGGGRAGAWIGKNPIRMFLTSKSCLLGHRLSTEVPRREIVSFRQSRHPNCPPVVYPLGMPSPLVRKAVAQVNCELARLSFARITNIVRPGDSHYYGFATELDPLSTPPCAKTVWFCNKTPSPHFIGPLVLEAPTNVPTKGEIIGGEMVADDRGRYSFKWWWVLGANSVLNFKRLMIRPNHSHKRSIKLWELLKMPRNGVDDLYVMFRVILYNDLHVVSDQLTASTKFKEVHPSRAKRRYTLRRGYELSRHPVEFMALVAMLCRAPAILRMFHCLVKDNSLDAHGESQVAKFNTDRLEMMLQS